MNNDLKDAEQVLRSRLGFAGQGAKSLPDIDYSKELLHSNRPVDISDADCPSSDEMMKAM